MYRLCVNIGIISGISLGWTIDNPEDNVFWIVYGWTNLKMY
jgi:hypothetical protein